MKPVLYISARSPFARRVRILFEELKIPYSAEMLDVFHPPDWFFEVNPLGRVPCLKLETGEVIIDSAQIQKYLADQNLNHPLFLEGGIRKAKLLSYSGLALGVMEQTVSYVLEKMRGVGNTLPIYLDEYRTSIIRALKFFEQELQGPFLTGSEFRVADVDLGTALAYCDLRLGTEVVDQLPKLRKYLNSLNSRDSFQHTKPAPL